MVPIGLKCLTQIEQDRVVTFTKAIVYAKVSS